MRIVGLSRTPLKGGRHERLDRAGVTASGLDGDREFLFTGAGRALRTMAHPALQTMVLRVDSDTLTLSTASGSVTQLAQPAGRSVVDYWGRPLDVDAIPGAISTVATRVLRTPVTLARCVDERAIYGARVGVLFVSELACLPTELRDPRRYRMNIVLDDLDAPIDPDAIAGRLLRLETVTLRLTEGMDRCVVIDRDPDTGTNDADVLASLPLRGGLPRLGFGADVIAAGALAVGDEGNWDG